MANVGDIARKLYAEIFLRDQTGAGADSVARNFDKVGDAADGAARTVERSSKVTESAERAYSRLQRRIDPLAAAQERLERDQRALARAQEQGVISADRYERNLRQLNTQYERTEQRIRAAERAQAGLNRETTAFTRIASAARGAVIGFLAAFSFTQIVQGARQSVAALDEVAKKARSLGGIETSAFLQEGRFALGQLGIDEGQRDKIFSDLQRRVGQFQLGTGELGTVLKRLDGGAEFGAALRNARTVEEQFDVALRKLAEVEDASERAALAGALFGEEAAKNVGALAEAGVEGFKALRAEAAAAGLSIEEDVLVRAEEMNDRYSKASQVIGANLKRAFAEVAPVIIGVIELASRLLQSVSEGIRNLRLSTADPQRVNDEAELRAIRRQTEERLNATARKIIGLNPEGEIARVAKENIDSLLRRLDEVDRRLEEIGAASGAGVNNALDEARALADDLRAGLNDGADAADQLERNLRGAGEAADIKFDPRRIDALVEAARIGPEEVARAKERFAIEDRIATLKVEAARLAAAEDAEGLAARLDKINRLQDDLKALTAAGAVEAPPREVAREFVDPYRRELEGVADDFVRRLARGDAGAFRDFADSLKNILLDRVLDPFARAFSNIIGSVFSGGEFSIFTPGINGGNPANLAIAGAGLNTFGAAGLAGASGGFGGVGPLALLQSSLTGFAQFGGQALVGAGNLLGAGPAALSGLNALGGVLGAGGFGFLGGSVLSDILGLSGTARRSVTGAATGAGLGFQLGTIVPGIGNVVGAVGGAIVGGIAGLFGGKPSNNAAGASLSLADFSVSGQFAKNNDPAAVKARDTVLEQSATVLRAIADLTGGDFGSLKLAIVAGVRDGIEVTSGGKSARFDKEDVSGAARAAIGFGVAGLRGGDAALTEVAKNLIAGGGAVEDVVARLETLKAALAAANEPVDEFRQRLDATLEAFDGLDRSSGALKDAFDGAIDALAKRANDENRDALLAITNPAQAALNEIVKQFTSRRDALEAINAEGGNVDLTLFDELARRQILGQFNAADALAQANDPVRYQLDQLLKAQQQQYDALRSVVGQFGVTEADLLTLVRAQEAQRKAAFDGLSDEDKARLAGLAEQFTDFGGRYALTVGRLIDESERLIDSYAETRRGLEQTIRDRGDEIALLGGTGRFIDQFARQQTPREFLRDARARLADLGEQAVIAERPEDRAAARRALDEEVRAFLERSRQVNASGAAFTADVAFARGLVDQARQTAEDERSAAERQLEQLDRIRQGIDDVRALLAAERLDIAALVGVAGGLPEDSLVRQLALELADLEASRTAQSDRLSAALEALTPADLGLGGGAPAPQAYAAPAPVSASQPANDAAPAPGVALAPTASGSPSPSRDTELINAVYAVEDAVIDLGEMLAAIERLKTPREERNAENLKLIASRRTGTLS